MAVLVAGGGGALGFHIIQRLHKEGFNDIRSVDLIPFRNTPSNMCSSYVCDISSAENPNSKHGLILREAMKGCTVVICSVMPPLMTAPLEIYTKCNVDAVRILLDESLVQGVHSFVHISSIAVMNHFVPHINCNEETPLPHISEYKSAYDITKRKGEDLVLRISNDKLWTCALRCGSLLNSHHDLIFLGKFKKLNCMLYNGGLIDTIDGVNVAWAVYLAVKELGKKNIKINRQSIFITKGEPLTVVEISKLINQ